MNIDKSKDLIIKCKDLVSRNEKSKDPITVDDFTNIMNDLVKYRNEYDKLVKEGSLNKELNLSYKKKIFDHEEALKKTYLVLNIRKNKFVCDTCTVELYMREIKEPLTIERLGKYFYKFFYTNKVNNNDKDDPESKKNFPIY